MNSFLWILSVLLAAIYAITGSGKVVGSRERLLGMPGMGWVAEVPMPQVRLIGALEIAGAIGVIVPWATGILTPLTPIAAGCLAALQIGAMWTHISRDERSHVWLNVVLLVVAIVVAIGRTFAAV